MLKTRIVTGVSLLLVLLAVLIWGGQLGWFIFVSVLLYAAFWEWDRLSGQMSPLNHVFAISSLAVFAGLWLSSGHLRELIFPLMALSSIFWLLVAPQLLRVASVDSIASNLFLYRFLGLVLIVSAGTALMLAHQSGLVFLLSVVAICWAADIFAYIFGKLFGRRKLAPRISPGKSWEGAVGGTASVLALSWIVVLLHPHIDFLQDTWQVKASAAFHPVVFTLWLIVLSAFSIVGDLFESLLKRRSGLKDSSNLLPGHGGVLDRIDAQLPVLPLAMLFLSTSA